MVIRGGLSAKGDLVLVGSLVGVLRGHAGLGQITDLPGLGRCIVEVEGYGLRSLVGTPVSGIGTCGGFLGEWVSGRGFQGKGVVLTQSNVESVHTTDIAGVHFDTLRSPGSGDFIVKGFLDVLFAGGERQGNEQDGVKAESSIFHRIMIEM